MQNITVAQFRARFREFRDTTAYPDSIIEMYILDTANEVNFDLFDARGPKAQALLVAHYLFLGKPFYEGYEDGGTPIGGGGEAFRLLASESEGDSSQSYVTSSSIAAGGLEGWLNLSAYGQEYWAMRQFVVPGVTSTGSVVMPNPRGRGRRTAFGYLAPGVPCAATAGNDLETWAYTFAFQIVEAIRDGNDAIIVATIAWPDGTTGVFTTDVASTAFPGLIDAWHATYAAFPSKTITQPLVTRDASGGIIAQPAIIIV